MKNTSFQSKGSSAELLYKLPFQRKEWDSALSHCHKTTSWSDDLPYHMTSHLPERSLDVLLSLYNRIFWVTVRTVWKQTIVIPIPEPGKDAAVPDNYRPISLTSFICILLENMVNFRQIWFLEKEKVPASIPIQILNIEINNRSPCCTRNCHQELLYSVTSPIGSFLRFGRMPMAQHECMVS